MLVSTCGERDRVSVSCGDPASGDINAGTRGRFLTFRLIVDEANISINSSHSHDTIKTLFVDYDGGLVMEPG